jgi:hypothetical protein
VLGFCVNFVGAGYSSNPSQPVTDICWLAGNPRTSGFCLLRQNHAVVQKKAGILNVPQHFGLRAGSNISFSTCDSCRKCLAMILVELRTIPETESLVFNGYCSAEIDTKKPTRMVRTARLCRNVSQSDKRCAGYGRC